jgi:hypothetical protein
MCLALIDVGVHLEWIKSQLLYAVICPLGGNQKSR